MPGTHSVEWALVAFTLFGQAAAGLVLAGLLARLTLGRRLGPERTAAATRFVTPVALGLIVLAALASLAHLGTPLGAYRALGNLGTSALAQEILLSGLFGALVLGSLLLGRRGHRDLLSETVDGLAAFAGLGLVLGMSRVYTATILPAWSTAYTPVAFLATSLVLGGLLLLVLLPAGREVAPARTVGLGLGLGGLALQLGGLPVYLASLGASPETAAQASLGLLVGALGPGLVAIVALGLVAVGVLVGLGLRGSPRLGLGSAALALVLAVALETTARLVFYASGVPITVG